SGAGKTTLLNLLGGMDVLSSGTIQLEEKLISTMSKKELTSYRRHDVGFVFQFY
ncbi:MAG TPA: macrolide ABC transporter ATP-binding protein, partial [Clostridiales bacterium]|nr:macrolide ABC transporter ATP-binding protein [Clostridiales bacterium]